MIGSETISLVFIIDNVKLHDVDGNNRLLIFDVLSVPDIDFSFINKIIYTR